MFNPIQININNESSSSSSSQISNKTCVFLNIILGFISLSFISFALSNHSSPHDLLNFLTKDFQSASSRLLNEKAISSNTNTLLTGIINDISKEQYNGNWTLITQNSSNIIATNESDGIVELSFGNQLNDSSKETEFHITFKCLSGRFIDNWKIVEASTLESDIEVINKELSIELISNYTSIQHNGQLFKESTIPQECASVIKITIDKDDNGMIDHNHILISFKSLCGFETELSLMMSNGKNTLSEKINFYVFIASTTATISMLINFYLIKMLTQAESNIKALSLTFISINTLWDLYCFIMNLIFSLKHLDYFFQLLTPTFLFFSLVLLVDCQLLYFYFKIQKKTMTQRNLLRKQIIFAIFFICGIIIAFLRIYDFFFTKAYVLFLLIMLWTPQIVHNVLWNNNTALPVVYTLLRTITRLSFPLYFRAYANNCFSIANEQFFITQCIACVAIPLMVVLMQTCLGARFFLPRFLQRNEPKEIYYYSLEDARNIYAEAMNEECVICLTKLFDQAASLTVGNKEQDDHVLSMDSASVSDQVMQMNSLTSERLASMSNAAMSLLLDFHEWKCKVNKSNLPYMITNCNHVFHSQCLEMWLRQKKKCPSCRKEITVISL